MWTTTTNTTNPFQQRSNIGPSAQVLSPDISTIQSSTLLAKPAQTVIVTQYFEESI